MNNTDGMKLVAALLLHQPGGRTIAEIGDEWFTDKELPAMTFIRRYYRTNGSYPSAGTLSRETGLRLPTPTETVEYWKEKVAHRHMYNEIIPKFRDLKTQLEGRTAEPELVHEILMDMLHTTRLSETRQTVFRADEAVNKVLEAYNRTKNNYGLAGIPTGHPEIDAVSGGYCRGDMNFILGRPQLGKTFHLLRSAIASSDAGNTSVLVSMEMDTNQLMYRMAGMIAGVDPYFIRTARMSRQTEERFMRALEHIETNSRITFLEGAMAKTVQGIIPVVQEFNPDIVYVDGVYLMMSGRSQRLIKRAERMESVVSEIKEQTLTGHRPWVCTSQFNRDFVKGGKKNALESASYSDAVGTDSSLVMALTEGTNTNGKRDTNILEIIKGRNGESGCWLVNHKFAPPNFSIIGEYNYDEDDTDGTSGTAQNESNFDWTPGTADRPE